MASKPAMGWRPGRMAGKTTLRKALKRRGVKGRDKYYKASLVLDQGRSQASAAYALWHWLVSHERSFVGIHPDWLVRLAAPKADAREACGQPVSIEALVNALEQQGVIGRSYWTNRASDVLDALLQGSGPVIVGSAWYGGMLDPNAEGFIAPSGRRLGRHAYLVLGYDAERDAFRLLNSWGPSWGQLGRAWLAQADLDHLLREGGEACVPSLAGDRGREWLLQMGTSERGIDSRIGF